MNNFKGSPLENIKAATAMNPLPEDMFSVNKVKYPIERCAPAIPAKSPHYKDDIYFITVTLIPWDVAASSFSPTTLIYNPNFVL